MPRIRSLLPAILAIAFVLPAFGQKVEPVIHELDNGMKFLFVVREGDPNIACGWISKFGSVNERPGVTGVAHLFEHMMFKGTQTIGTKDIDKDLQIIEQLDEVRSQIAEEERKLHEQVRVGEIADARDPKNRSERHTELRAEFDRLLEEQSKLIKKDEFDRIYRLAGGSGMNAGTTNDFTIYFINVPSNKLELWYWMESDRLANPVFREFYSERDVVFEERRLRVDSTPTGKLDEQFEAMFWQSSPYHWPVIGWPSDLYAITRDEAAEFFGTYYAPNNLTAVLVGDFDPEEAKSWADQYFGRLKRGETPALPIRTREVAQQAEMRMTGYAETRPTVRVRWHTVPDGHVDESPLMVLASILNGRTGRLFKSLVLEQQVATNAGAGINGLRYDGYFELSGVARPGKTLDDVEKALYAELEVLKTQPVGDRELQKIKNQQLAGDFRKLESKFGLMLQLLVYDSLGNWENINAFSDRIQNVSAGDIMRVAREYFSRDNRAVAHYLPLSDDPELKKDAESSE